MGKRSLGKVGICWIQPPRVDHMCKKMWVGGRRKFLQGGTCICEMGDQQLRIANQTVRAGRQLVIHFGG
jgi:hypothetical protein